MTTTPSTQRCPSCGSFVNYEGHSELANTLVPHRFHCHSCGRVYMVRSTSHQPPRFALRPRHEVQQALDHEHNHEEGAALNAPSDEPFAPATVQEQGEQPEASPTDEQAAESDQDQEPQEAEEDTT